jgi:hypothetical protein
MTFKTLQTAGSRIRSGQRRFFNRARDRDRPSIFFGGRVVRLFDWAISSSFKRGSTTKDDNEEEDEELDDEVDALPPWEFLWGCITRRDDPESPGSDGASPYQPALPSPGRYPQGKNVSAGRRVGVRPKAVSRAGTVKRKGSVTRQNDPESPVRNVTLPTRPTPCSCYRRRRSRRLTKLTL